MDDSSTQFGAALLDALPGPAALAGPDGVLRAANVAWLAATSTVVLPTPGTQLSGLAAPPGLANAASDVASGRLERVSVPSPASIGSAEGPGVLVVSAFVAEGRRWLLLRREPAADVADELDHRFRSLVGGVDAGVMLIDAAGRVTACNPTAARLLGRAAGELVGTNVLRPGEEVIDERGDPIDPLDRPPGLTLRTGEPSSNVVIGVRRGNDDSLVWLRVNVRPLRERESSRGVVMSFVDVTSQRWVVQERRAAQQALAEAHAAAVRSSRLKSEFLATMSHEIRTPMSSIVALIELMLDQGGKLPPELRELVLGVQRSAGGLLDLIEDFLDLAKIEAGRFELAEADVDVADLVHGVTTIVGSRARAKQLSLAAYVDPAIGILTGDAARLRQVLLNLVGNAVKFTRTGEVVARVDTLTDLGEAVRVRFSVTDTGIGISPMDAEHLFEPFVRGSLDTSAEGTGLGLSICQRLVTAMGGRLEFDSEVGKGSTFTFDLTLPRSAGGVSAQRPRGRDGQVLVVDRHPETARALADTVRGWGMTARVAGSDSEAVQALAEGGWHAVLGEPVQPDTLLRAQLAPAGAGGPEAGGVHPRMVLLVAGEPPRADPDSSVLWLAKPVAPERLWAAVAGETGPVERRARSRELPRLAGQVLLAEDNEVNRGLITRMLERLGLQVRGVGRGDDAVEAVLGEPALDLVLMDVHMPGLNGFEATARIRAAGDGRAQVPILALTASATAGDREACLAAGMNGHVGKPVTLRGLAQALRPWLDADRPAAGSPRQASAPGAPASAGGGAEPEVIDLTAFEALRTDLRDESLLVDMVQMYLRELPQRRAALVEAARLGDVEALGTVAHTLKSASAMFGLRRLAAVCGEVESLARSDQLGPAQALVSEVERECAQAARRLPELAGGYPSPSR